jgi:SOS-response transcriptional repressor LexA
MIRAKQSDKQIEVYQFLVDYFNRNDQLPSCRAISNHFGWSSDNAAFCFMSTLQKRGFIEKNDAGKWRFSRGKS